MSSYARQAKRAKEPKRKGPRCCGQHMQMDKSGLWYCRKCGRRTFDIGPAPTETAPEMTTEQSVKDFIDQGATVSFVPEGENATPIDITEAVKADGDIAGAVETITAEPDAVTVVEAE